MKTRQDHLIGALTLVVAAAVAGCANSSGVMKAGPDTYTISTSASPGRGGLPAAKRMAYEEANNECARQGREVFSLSEKGASPTWTEGVANFELNFRCLTANDPEFQRQQLRSSPDKVIEKR